VAAAVRRQKEKAKAKEMNAENKNMQAQRSREKQHNASVAMGNKGFIKEKSGGRGGGAAAGGAGRKIGDVSGSRSQWVALLNLVRAGGREESRGRTAVDFGGGFSSRVMSKAARDEKAHMKPYQSLPQHMRDAMSRPEYEDAHVRGTDDEEVPRGSCLVSLQCLTNTYLHPNPHPHHTITPLHTRNLHLATACCHW